MTSSRYLIPFLLFQVLMWTSCTKEAEEPDTLMTTPQGTLTMQIDQGSWTTQSVDFYDQGNMIISLMAYSSTHGAMEVGMEFTGTGSYTYNGDDLGLWNMSPDTNDASLFFTSVNSAGSSPSGSFIITTHDQVANTLSGSFDIYLTNSMNDADSIHLQGIFEEVVVSPVSPEPQSMNAEIDGVPFEQDYVVTELVGNTVYLHMVKDIRKRIIVRIERGNLSATTYTMNDITLPLGITYANVYQEYNQALSGTAEVTIHNAGSILQGTPGATICTYSVTNGDFGTTDPVQISGDFDVEYGF